MRCTARAVPTARSLACGVLCALYAQRCAIKAAPQGLLPGARSPRDAVLRDVALHDGALRDRSNPEWGCILGRARCAHGLRRLRDVLRRALVPCVLAACPAWRAGCAGCVLCWLRWPRARRAGRGRRCWPRIASPPVGQRAENGRGGDRAWRWAVRGAGGVRCRGLLGAGGVWCRGLLGAEGLSRPKRGREQINAHAPVAAEKKIFLSPYGGQHRPQNGAFRHGPVFRAMIFASAGQAARPEKRQCRERRRENP